MSTEQVGGRTNLQSLLEMDSNAIDDVLREQVEEMDRNARTDLLREAQLWENAAGEWFGPADPHQGGDRE